ncbi:ABC transporter permease [Mangrovibrevibacter kandeliae]|uniref:ABC transporter permease n=1 Tax=Mangrovibrevibacter kandeliae TaxID=2968473 RepID=UPI00211874EC|nr:ABC transporter permease [Aurantimonas sp. CSK15Z-1]MCQ8784166.1 ABC transporter permease [Aurantimonas sp. CSK15Z-1]MCQ8784273.1 ABC transporter permease [Aurantimonas sp. CSK15Z-1]
MSAASAGGGGRWASTGYGALFYLFLFGPLLIMTGTAFNSSSFPRLSPWECFTTDWFGVLLNDRRLMDGLWTSAGIGLGVVLIAVPMGLAGALALSEIAPRLRAALYTVLITPVLVPGVVLGISTIVFWGQVGRALGMPTTGLFFDGVFLTIAGQVTFVSAYAMLIFSARLQRFDPTLTEAALDLGASPGQAFRKILLPFLRPAIASAAFLTLLASFENYNTTVFTILADATFTTALASKVRYGIDPSLSALAVIIIALTLIGAITHEAVMRRRAAILSGRAARSRLYGHPAGRLAVHPATILALLVALAGLAVWQGSRYDSSACRAGVLEERRALQEKLMQEQRARMRQTAPAPAVPTEPPAPGGNGSGFGGAFGSGLRPGGSSAAPAPTPAAPSPAAPGSPPPAPGSNPAPATPFGGAFQGIRPPGG